MPKGIRIFALVLFLAADATLNAEEDRNEEGIDVLLLVAKNYGLNYFLNRDVLEGYGWNLVHAGVTESVTACPPVAAQLKVPPLVPDVLVKDIGNVEDFDAIAIMPAAGQYNPVPDSFDDLRKSPETLKLVSAAREKGIPLFAVCSGVRVLAAADVLEGIKVVGSPRFQEEYEAAGAVYLGKDHPPNIDGGIVTCARDLYYHFLNCQALATAVERNRKKTGPKAPARKEFISSGSAGFAEGKADWARTYGGTGSDGGRALCGTKDGGFLITGYTFSRGTGDSDVLVIKTDSEGKMEWYKTFGSCGTEYGLGCAAAEDGFLVTGYTTSAPAQSKDVLLIKLDDEGREVWTRTYGGASWDVGTSVCQAAGGYLVCGYTHSFGAGEEDVYLIKTDAEGREAWSRTFGGERWETGNSVCMTEDGDILLGATTGSFGKGNCDFYLIRTDKEGKEIWSKPFGTQGRRGYGFDGCSAMAPSGDGGAFLVGHTDCQDVQDVHVVRVDAEGREAWTRSFGGKPFYDYGNAVEGTSDGGCVVAGTTKAIGGRADVCDNDVWARKLDSSGKVVWRESMGGMGSDWGSAVHVDKKGACYLLGRTNSEGRGAFDVLFIKMR